MTLTERLNSAWFRFVHQRNLVYNACWEDPRLDREALDLGPLDRVLVITSAGCNALDYALERPEHIHAVDLNARQNALLDLKLAGIRRLDYERFFGMFGRGRLPGVRVVYESELRSALAPPARAYWDRHIDFFSGRGWRRSFYFRGTSGTFARLVNGYLDGIAGVRDQVEALLGAGSVAEQRSIYERSLRDEVWSRWVRWAVGRDLTLSLLGVPRPQRQQVERDYSGGIARFIEDCVEAVFARLPLRDNYFWRVYLTGEYTPECCPEYLKPANFERLQHGLADRISTHTCSVTDFLKSSPRAISRFVLLDHMDWLSSTDSGLLEAEWQAIVERAAPRARVIWRSGGLRADFVDQVEVRVAGKARRVGEILEYDRALADQLHPLDRVHTYGSFWIANLAMRVKPVQTGTGKKHPMQVATDIRTIYHLTLTPIRGATHAERLQCFYDGQAAGYDSFRERLLPGREELIHLLDLPAGGVWIDLGGGTGANLAFAGERLSRLACVQVVDLCPPLLEIADQRIRQNDWNNVSTIFADASMFEPQQAADVVTFSYSLTMIPDWFAAIDRAHQFLKPGGLIGVVDFHISRKYVDGGRARHGWLTRALLPLWFGGDNVVLSHDHLPYLEHRFTPIALKEDRTRIPWMPFVEAPYFLFIGRKE